MRQVLAVLFGALFTGSASYAAGHLLLRRIPLFRIERHVLNLTLGAALLSNLVFLIAACQAAYPAVLVLAGVALIAVAVYKRDANYVSSPSVPRGWAIGFGFVFGVYTVLYFVHALAPESSADGTTYHLGLVSRYLRTHGFGRITTNMYANLSEGMEMLFLFAFAFGKHSAAALVHYFFLLTLPLLLLAYSRRVGEPAAGCAGALIVFLSPVIGLDGVSAYIDVALACVLFSVFYLLQIWDSLNDDRLLIPVGILAGFAYGLKYTAFLAVPYALGFILWRKWRKRESVIRPVILAGIFAALWMAPWIIKNLVVIGNPFSPFANRFFPNPYIYVSFEKMYVERMRVYDDLKSYAQVPWEACVRGGILRGLLGPVFLLAPVALLGLRKQPVRRLLFAAAVFGVTYLSNVGSRFLIPALPFISLAMGMVLVRFAPAAIVVIALHAVLSWPALTKLYCDPYAWRLPREIPWKAALRLESQDEYLKSRIGPSYEMVQFIEKNLPPGSRILSYNPPPEAYTTRDIMVAYQSALGNDLGDYLFLPFQDYLHPTKLLRFRVPKREYRTLRVVQLPMPQAVEWTVIELRVIRDGIELPRIPEWRLQAHPNPWGVQYAFDNSPVTRWRSRENRNGGMFMQVDLSRIEAMDAVEITVPANEPAIALRLEGMTAAGTWETITDTYETAKLPAPVGLRRMAVLEVKAKGIDYVYMTKDDYAAVDMKSNRRVWGLTLVADIGGHQLYRID